MWWWCVLDTPDHLLSLSVCRVSKPQNVGNQEGEPRALGITQRARTQRALPRSTFLIHVTC